MAATRYKWLWLATAFLLLGFSFKEHLPSAAVSPHPFYVSVTEINHNAKTHSLEISCKMFAEDLEDVLKQNYKTPVDLSNEKQKPQTDKLVSDYVSKHLALTVDGRKLPLTYVGFEKESESAYAYFEVPNVAAVKKLDAVNSLLQDFSNQQINIMHVIVGGNRKSYKLDYPQTAASFSF